MKKPLILLFSSALLLSSCGTYTGSGAYVGGSFGSILGSAIGGIAGGPRGSDIGTIIGMAGGAAVGAAIGNQADQQQEERIQQRRECIRQRQDVDYQSNQGYDRSSHNADDTYLYNPNTNSGFDSTNSGDDRLYDFTGSDYTGSYSAQQPITSYPSSSSTVDEINAAGFSYCPLLEIVNARFVDDNQDNELNRNETCKVIFEVFNRGNRPVYDVVPTVVETTGNKHIYISPNIHVEKIDAGKGIRYTAMVKADSRLKPGIARFCVSVIHGDKAISKVNEFNIPTTK